MGKITNELIDHDFDGIQEYDNDLPGWWKSLFWITIIISIIYVPYYHLVGDLQDVEYQKEMGTYVEADASSGTIGYSSPYAGNGEMTPALRAEMDKVLDAPFDEQILRAMSKADADQLAALETAFPEVYASYVSGGVSAPAAAAAEPEDTAPAALAVLSDDASLEAGKKVWDTQCFSCHLSDGGGLIGPNMTDDYWIHGGDMASIVHLINVGVPAKGMVPWETILTPDQVTQVASFIKVKLVGTTPATAKAPEGDLFEG